MNGPLDEWIRSHQVCWDIVPLRGRRAGERPGFELTLLARCGPPSRVDPARPECHQGYDRLVDIVAHVLPPDTARHVEAYDAAVHLRPESSFAPEVELIVEVFPPADQTVPVWISVEAALRRLGVRRKAWSEADLVTP